MSWSSAIEALRVALAGAAPELVELPSASIESAAQTLAVPGQTGYAVMPVATAWSGGTQRTQVKASHDVTISLIATAKQHGNEHDTLSRVLDLEQAILAAVLEVSSNPGVAVEWTGTARDFDASRVYLLSVTNLVLTQCEPTGANL